MVWAKAPLLGATVNPLSVGLSQQRGERVIILIRVNVLNIRVVDIVWAHSKVSPRAFPASSHKVEVKK